MYLLRVVDGPVPHINPSAKMPRVLFPAAEPAEEAVLDAVADPFVSEAKLYLLRVVEVTPHI